MPKSNLMLYFSPNGAKPPEVTTSSLDNVSRDTTSSAARPSTAKRSRSGTPKNSSAAAAVLTDDDLENDPILPPQNGNSITKYFSPVDRATALKRKVKPSVLTVEVQIHGSPKKQGSQPVASAATKKAPKKKKRKVGIPGSLADTIELLSSEQVVMEPNSRPEGVEPPKAEQPQADPPTSSKPPLKLRIRLDGLKPKVTSDNSEDSDFHDGPRRSTRIRLKPPTTPLESDPEIEVPVKKVLRKKRKKAGGANTSKDDDEIKIISEDIAPIFLKKKRDEEMRAVKKAKQDFLFSGVPEVLKQQTIVQQALEQRPVEIFPRISHVTQAGSQPWCLPYPNQLSLMLRKNPSESVVNRPTTFSSSLNSLSVAVSQRSIYPKQASYLEWRYCKEWITRLKEDHSLSFPFFRTLRALLPKANKEDGNVVPWTDAYAPKRSVDILANRKPAQRLKNWLNQWKLKAGEEVILSPKKTAATKVGKRKRISSDCSDTEEAPAAEEVSNQSWNSEEQLCTCVLLMGPPGCGKTATIYALAEELGYNVLEVNASSKRNGKTVLSHLQEATQSHSLNNNSNSSAIANGMNKLFFGAKAAAKPSRPETPKPAALSLVLFEDIDIVFDEDESFYSALTTLIQTSKRPIVLTLGSAEERALAAVQERFKSYFEVYPLRSPSHSVACGYLWSVCLAEGYPLEWKALENWVKRRALIDVDLRSLLLQLQFLLQSHPMRLKLNFGQLQLKNEDESPTCEPGWRPSSDSSDSTPVQLIELPVVNGNREWPYNPPPRSLRFRYDVDCDSITVVDKKKSRLFRMLTSDGPAEPNSTSGSIGVDEPPLTAKEKWRGDLTPLARCLDLRSGKELFSSWLAREDLSCSDANLMHDIQQLMTERCSKLMENDLAGMDQTSPEDCLTDIRRDQSTKTTNDVLLQGSISRSMLLQRKSHTLDLLPYLRTFVRHDLEHTAGKRKRKSRTQLESPTTRLPTLDLILTTSSAVELANSF